MQLGINLKEDLIELDLVVSLTLKVGHCNVTKHEKIYFGFEAGCGKKENLLSISKIVHEIYSQQKDLSMNNWISQKFLSISCNITVWQNWTLVSFGKIVKTIYSVIYPYISCFHEIFMKITIYNIFLEMSDTKVHD